ncbi:hypothetical protein Slala03_77970 [Streptomyces lavendulae subsp. lavendulae]|nr:hypothetical protein Slala03_77970 [Streptomyces lavendulae subsp. lavendulae]
MRVAPWPSANRSGSTAAAGLVKPIDEQHIADPGLVVGGDEDTVRAVMRECARPVP